MSSSGTKKDRPGAFSGSLDLFPREPEPPERTDERAVAKVPLAERMRPRSLAEYAGQAHLVGDEGVLRGLFREGRLFSVIFWGPPGSGKTTLARLAARETKASFETFSAVLSGVKEIRDVVGRAQERLRLRGTATILFVDEIHRFNKAQQDAFLPHVEGGLITLMGATTENPSFEVIAPLLSRVRVLILNPLSDDDLAALLGRALADDERGLGSTGISIDPAALGHLVAAADGDARVALNSLEAAAALAGGCGGGGRSITLAVAEQAVQRRALRYDKAGEEHYNLISAFHKSLRGSDPDAALYWLARMLEGGEQPLYIARRMVRFASEDVGLADPNALTVALNAMEAFRFLGLPEADLALAEAALYLATAPKSNALYRAMASVRRAIDETGSLPVPHVLRNAPTGLMQKVGYGKGYRYAHDYPEAQVRQDSLPEKLGERSFYEPTDRGYEARIRERLLRWRDLRERSR